MKGVNDLMKKKARDAENFIYHSAMMAIHKNKNIKKIILTTDQGLIKNGVQAIERRTR